MSGEISDADAFKTYVWLRMNRWGMTKRWLKRVGMNEHKPGAISSWWGPCVLDGNVEQIGLETTKDVCPWNLDEYRETELCVNALPGHLSVTVIEEHAKLGTREEKAQRIGVDRSTMARRLNIAHTLLLELFQLVSAGLPLECNYQGRGRPRNDPA